MKKDDEILGPELPDPDKTTTNIVKMCLYALLFTAVAYVILVLSFHLSYNSSWK